VDPERFLEGLPGRFEDFPRSEHPLDDRFVRIADEIENLARPNNLALLNHAASCLESGEAYVEIGVFHGASLVAAMLDNEHARFVGIDSFEHMGASPADVEASLERFRLPRPELIVGDAFELVPAGALGDVRVGVWYYDAAHDYESQLEGLRMGEPWLAPGALLVVDDTDWERVERALEDYLAGQPLARRILTLEGKDRGSPHWWEGMQVLAWGDG
jgi:hypothetical protein